MEEESVIGPGPKSDGFVSAVVVPWSASYVLKVNHLESATLKMDSFEGKGRIQLAA
jgi:hypothetical protein